MRNEFTIENIPELLAELERAKLIIRYSNSSTDYVQITKWWDYQSAMRRIFPSHYPPPEGWQDIVKGVSDGQTPTTADKQHPEEEEEEEPETETRIKEEEGAATTATETAKKAKIPETHEGPEGATVTAEEAELLGFMETLEGWRFGRAEDLVWLREFLKDCPEFDLSLAKACRDYHSGRASPKHKGIWKNRFREWVKHERQFQMEQRGRGGKKLPTADTLKRGWKGDRSNDTS